jgi:hypothetical protein
MTAEDRMARAWRTILYVLAMVVAAMFITLLMGIVKGLAHDEDHNNDAWYSSLKQPDNPSISCCGLADAYWCDDYYARDGKAYCRVTDDRDDAKLGRPHIDIGTEFEIPPYKLKFEQDGKPTGNPTGHAVIFVNMQGHVWCYVQAGGV